MASSGTADVTVMGAGIFGLACAWECARRGARVQVIERDRIGAGSSGGFVGALAPHVPENWNAKKAFQLDSLLMANRFWAEIGEVSGTDPGYARSGRLQPVGDQGALALARQRAQTAEELWADKANWQVVPETDFPDWRPLSGTGMLVHDSLTARIHPRKAALALAAAIRAKGGCIEEHRSEPPAGIFEKRRNAGVILWSTGVQGLADLSADLGRSVGSGVKGQAALLVHDARSLPQIFADGLHIVPHGDGTVAVGSTSEREFGCGSDTDDRLEDLISRARRLCPSLVEATVKERWAGIRPRSKTRSPMLGEWPDRPGHFVANGGFKIGYGMAPKVAMVIADLMLDGRDAIPDGFRVQDNL